MSHTHTHTHTQSLHSIKDMAHRFEIFRYLPHRLRDVIAFLNFAKLPRGTFFALLLQKYEFSMRRIFAVKSLCRAVLLYVCMQQYNNTSNAQPVASASCNVEAKLTCRKCAPCVRRPACLSPPRARALCMRDMYNNERESGETHVRPRDT